MDDVTIAIAAAETEPVAGQRLKIGDLELLPYGRDGLWTVESLSDFKGATLILAAFGQGLSCIYGSASLIAPGIALAAGHVIRQHSDEGLFGAEDGALYAFGVSETGLQAWQVMRITYDQEGDAAILILAYACAREQTLEINHFKASARLPKVGDRVTAVGFRPAEGRQALLLQEQALPSVSGTFLLSSGPVLEVWGEGRDRVMAPRPCFAAKLATVGAMSGGPILDSDGHVIGLVTSSYEAEADYYTIGTMIWDALLMRVDPVWPPRFWQAGAILKELIDPIEGWRLRFSDDGAEWRYEVGN